jgi:hypothetical protein
MPPELAAARCQTSGNQLARLQLHHRGRRLVRAHQRTELDDAAHGDRHQQRNHPQRHIAGSPVADLQFTRTISFADGDQVITITDSLPAPDQAISPTSPHSTIPIDQNTFTTANDVERRGVCDRDHRRR